MLLLVAVAAMAITAALVIMLRAVGGPDERLLTASIFPEARPVPSFKLHDAAGQPFTEDDLTGRISLLFFGFTHCPDICPDTLTVLARALAKLDSMRVERRPQVVFVSVDPQRDDGEAMQAYVENFDPEFIAVTGDDEALARLTNPLGILYARNAPDAQGFYTVDHSGMVVIVDSGGRVLGRFRQGSDADAIAADLFQLVRDGV
ncbi:MAG: SCO family protein [Wenzhouxiangellaceae bacterium]|nr:SCO family protein [Wenzhouxiangellaceae bacterium]